MSREGKHPAVHCQTVGYRQPCASLQGVWRSDNSLHSNSRGKQRSPTSRPFFCSHFLDARTAEGKTVVDLLAGGGACGDEMSAAAAIMPDASSSLPQYALDATNSLRLDLGGALAHHGDRGGALASAVSPLLVASAAPGNPSTASGLFGIAALVIALGAG